MLGAGAEFRLIGVNAHANPAPAWQPPNAAGWSSAAAPAPSGPRQEPAPAWDSPASKPPALPRPAAVWCSSGWNRSTDRPCGNRSFAFHLLSHAGLEIARVARAALVAAGGNVAAGVHAAAGCASAKVASTTRDLSGFAIERPLCCTKSRDFRFRSGSRAGLRQSDLAAVALPVKLALLGADLRVHLDQPIAAVGEPRLPCKLTFVTAIIWRAAIEKGLARLGLEPQPQSQAPPRAN